MKKVNLIVWILLVLLSLNACSRKQYALKSVNGYLVEMNSDRDAKANPAMLAFVNRYKTQLDVEMNEIIGESAQTLTKSAPQSLLTNFTTDAMQEYAAGLWGKVDFALINNGGLRSTLNKGLITVGDLYEIYAFENRLVLLELPGKALKELFDSFAQRRVEGVSKGVRLVVNNKAVESLTIANRPLDEKASYRIATVDYLAEGNDGMAALTQAVKYTDSTITLRDALIEYIKKLTAENKKIDAKLDDRIEIKE